MLNFGSVFRRVEQGLLQSVGLAQSSLKDDAEAHRLDALEASLRRLTDAASAHAAAARRAAEASVVFATTIVRTISETPTAGDGARALDAKPIARLAVAHRSAVVGANGGASATALARLGTLLIEVASLRAELASRVDRALDHDSYSRRADAAKHSLASARTPAERAELSEALKKATGKAKDAAALVAQMTARTRARLDCLERAILNEASEAALGFLAGFAHEAVHAAEAAGALMTRFPGAAIHAAELAGSTAARAEAILSVDALRGGEEGGGGDASTTSSSPSSASLSDAARSALTVLGADSASFAELHAAAAPEMATAVHRAAPSAVAGGSLLSAGILVRPLGYAPGPLVDLIDHSNVPPADAVAQGGALGAGQVDDDDDDADATPQPTRTARTHSRSSERQPASPSLTAAAPASPVATGAQMSSARAPVVSGNTAATTGGGESCWCVATFDFTPTNDDELELKKGASVRVLERGSREGGDEWWRGSSGVQDVEGLFPANRVRVLSRDAARAAGLADGPMPTPSARLLSPASASAQFSFDAFDGAGKGGAGDAFDFFGGGATSGSTTGF